MSAATPRVHWRFWVIGVIAFLWNAAGAANFIVQMNPDMVSAYRPSEQTIIEGRPLWATLGFALAVFGGAVGSLLLLLRKSAAINFFIASLLGVIVTMIHALSGGIAFGAAEIVGVIIMPIAVAAFLIWYARRAARSGAIN